MRRRYAARRRLALAMVAGALAPLMVITLPSLAPAAVAAEATDWAGATFALEGGVSSVGTVECWLAVRLTAGGAAESDNGECFGGIDVSPGFKQVGEYGTPYSISLEGPGCAGGAEGTFAQGSEDSIWHTHSLMNFHSWLPGAGCDPSSVCLRIEEGGSYRFSCEPVNLAPPDTSTSCPFGHLAGIDETGYTWGGTGIWNNNVTMRVTVKDTAAQWDVHTYLVVRMNTGVVQLEPFAGRQVLSTDPWERTITQQAARDPAAPDRAVIGGGFIAYKAGSNTQTEYSLQLPQDVAGGGLGVTDPDKCTFYMGEKVAATSGDELDEPMGPMGEPPAAAAPTNPRTPADDTPIPENEGSFWEAVVRALRALAGAIGGIAASILNGLEAMFMPDASSWGWGGLVEQVQARPPASVVIGLSQGVGSVADGYSGAGECGILADFRSEDIPDAVITCQQAKAIPGYGALYGLVTAALLAFTGLGLFKMFSGMLQDGQ